MPLVRRDSHPKSQLQESAGNVIFSFPGSVVQKGVLEKCGMECRGPVPRVHLECW